MATDWVVVHHRGGGRPSTAWNDDVYSLVVGGGRWTLNHGAAQDKSTAGLNRKVFGICFDGNRHEPAGTAFAVTEDDLNQLRAGVADARRRGYLTDTPRVDFHGDPSLWKYGNATACPGNLTYERRTAIVDAIAPAPFDVAGLIEYLGVLQPGAKGDRVKYLQGLLNVIFPQAGFKMSGNYGPKTSLYVRRIRALVGLNANNAGTGPEVWKALLFFAGSKG